MEEIEDISLGPMPLSKFLSPLRMTFKQNGQQRYWDFIKLYDCVSIILFNTSRNVLVFVKQFRPVQSNTCLNMINIAVYFGSADASATSNAPVPDVDWTKVPFSNGITLELCAGMIDNSNLSPAEIAKQEVLEECGYDVPIDNFKYVSNFLCGVGVSGEKNTMFYAEVTDAMKTGQGGGNLEDGELIDIVELTIPEVRKYIDDEKTFKSPGCFLYAVTWFLLNKSIAC